MNGTSLKAVDSKRGTEMNEVKSLVESRTFWGAVVALLASGLSLLHYTLTSADAASLTELLTALGAAAGTAFAIYGRVVASKRIGGITPPAVPVILLAIGVGTLAPVRPAVAQTASEAPIARAGAMAASPAPRKHVAPAHHAAAATAASASSSSAPGGKLSQNQAQQNPVLVIQQFTLTDLQAALADAQGQTPPDTIAATCYQALITLVGNPVANPLPSGPGAFQLFQKGRDIKNMIANLQAQNGPLSALNVACAPLIVDLNTTLIRLGIMGGAVAGGAVIGLPPLGSAAPGSWLAYQKARDRMVTASGE
jgi:hypothetical protein